jgi:hypothetical protein
MLFQRLCPCLKPLKGVDRRVSRHTAYSDRIQLNFLSTVAAEGNPTEEDDSELPPIGETVIPSTNPLYPNAIVKKPPNTHSKAESAADESVSENDEERKKAAPLPLPSTPKVLTGKNAPVSYKQPLLRITIAHLRLTDYTTWPHD